MNRPHFLAEACGVLFVVFLGVVSSGHACEIEAVIDWYRATPFIDNGRHPLAHIVAHGWDNLASAPSWRYAAWGSSVNTMDIFVPPDNHPLGEPITICQLAGVVSWTNGMNPPELSGYPKQYTVFRWVDVNQNGNADPGDKIAGPSGGLQEQNWEMLASGTYDENGKVFNLFKDVDKPVTFVPGLTYILIIRATGWYKLTDMNGHEWAVPSTNWQWTGAKFFKQGNENFSLVEADRPGITKIWDPDIDNRPLVSKYGPAQSEAGPWKGIDDYEILRIRFNQPPLIQTLRKPGG